MFTVHTKLSAAHTGDFNHTKYTLKERYYITPHSASVKKIKKEMPTYPTYFFVACHRNQTFFYLALASPVTCLDNFPNYGNLFLSV